MGAMMTYGDSMDMADWNGCRVTPMPTEKWYRGNRGAKAFRRWIRRMGYTHKQVAEIIGVSRSRVTSWLCGYRLPDKGLRADIQLITVGQVTTDLWEKYDD